MKKSAAYTRTFTVSGLVVEAWCLMVGSLYSGSRDLSSSPGLVTVLLGTAQGCALEVPMCHRQLTFVFKRLEKLGNMYTVYQLNSSQLMSLGTGAGKVSGEQKP